MNRITFRWMGGLGLIALAAALASVILGGPVIAWGAPGAQGEALPPQIVETAPLAGQELTLDGSVTFYFDQAMDPASVEAAFAVAPDTPGDLAWPDDSTLVFTPSEPYARATEYTFTIGVGATSAQGAALEDVFALSLQTIGYLEVSEVLPAPDTTAVDTDSVITVIFNRPVVPLVTVEDMSDLPQPLVFDPPVEGTGEWLNTSIYLFTPAGELKGGTDYTVTVRAGLEDVTGGVLQDDYTWTFTTIQPDVVEISPGYEQSGVPLDTTIKVTFSQAMDPDAVAEGFTLSYLGPFPSEAEWGEPVPVAGEMAWSDDARLLTFTPDAMLELGSAYEVALDAAKTLSATGAPLRAPASSRFFTVPPPAILRTSPADGEVDASPYGGFTIYFASPMDIDSLEDKVIIEPEPWREFDAYFYDYSNSYTLSFDTEPSTQYTITILPGMADVYGNTIDEGMVVSYVTAPYPPEVAIQAAGSVGVYSSYNPTTRVFVTHRNISRLDLGLWRMSLAQLAKLTGPDSYDAWQTFTPATRDLLRRWTISVSSQQDQRRYELLYISERGTSGISNIQCLGAPESRVGVGDVAIVSAEDPRPLTVRLEAKLGAQVITHSEAGSTFQFIDGPFCEGGYLWWNIRLDDGITGWAAEGSSEVYFFEPLGAQPADPNAPRSSDGNLPPALAPGIYYLQIESPETTA